MRQVVRVPSPAMVIGVIALLAALGGTAVGAKVLNKGAVKKVSRSQANTVFNQRFVITEVESASVTISPGGLGFPRVDCPSGSTVVGTGFNDGIGDVDFVKKYGSFVGGAVFNDTSITIRATVQAICGPLPPGSVFSSDQDQARAEFQADQQGARLAHSP